MIKSSSFVPTSVGYVSQMVGHDSKGKPRFSSKKPIRFSPVRMEVEMASTSIRVDKAGSKSRAEEDVAKGRMLVAPTAEFKRGDRFSFSGRTWRIVSIWPRYEMDGRLNHYQVDMVTWR